MKLRYYVVDVFTQHALEGNPLAVFPDAGHLDAATMQRIARELNLSETTFVLAPQSGGAANVRIFTPTAEMRFAGHPTIGTAFVLRHLGRIPLTTSPFVLEELVGPVPVRVDDGVDPILWLTTPQIRYGSQFDAAACARAVGLNRNDLLPEVACALLSAGNPNIYIAVKDRASVDRALVDTTALATLVREESEPVCIFVFTPTGEGAYSRMFAEELGVVEDPATGSATGPLAQFMMDNGLVSSRDGTRFVSEQGTKMQRRSILHVIIHGEGGADGIEVGGNCVLVAEAQMTISG